jgi:hypothetical protein
VYSTVYSTEKEGGRVGGYHDFVTILYIIVLRHYYNHRIGHSKRGLPFHSLRWFTLLYVGNGITPFARYTKNKTVVD